MRPRDLFRGPRGSQVVNSAFRGSNRAIGLVWWVFRWFIGRICLYNIQYIKMFQIFSGTDGRTGPIEGSTRGPRGPKNSKLLTVAPHHSVHYSKEQENSREMSDTAQKTCTRWELYFSGLSKKNLTKFSHELARTKILVGLMSRTICGAKLWRHDVSGNPGTLGYSSLESLTNP